MATALPSVIPFPAGSHSAPPSGPKGPAVDFEATDALAGFVRARYEEFRNARDGSSDIQQSLIRALHRVEGQYDAVKLAEIKRFGGSEIYMRIVAVKCRAATALLREIYAGSDRAWEIKPTPDPKLPDDILAAVRDAVAGEVQAASQLGQPPDRAAVIQRSAMLVGAAMKATRKAAAEQAREAEAYLDDDLVQGGFYEALVEFLHDVPIFPFAVLKGPVIRMTTDVRWGVGGVPETVEIPRMFWERVDPFQFYWSAGSKNIEGAEIVEKLRLSRSDLDRLIDVPGYDVEAIRNALRDYDQGLYEFMGMSDSEQAMLEHRPNRLFDRTGLIDALEYHGTVPGRFLIEKGFDKARIGDPDREVYVCCWVVGRYVVKVQLNPSPRKRHPYYVTSFAKTPGSIVGNGLPIMLGDVEDVANASMRAMVNNMAIASGPQVVVDVGKLAVNTDADTMYPWKRWLVDDIPPGQTRDPVTFFQPSSNVQELLAVYDKMVVQSDDLSAIPRYMQGGGAGGGAGRTASGLAMLMQNASKTLQNVTANIDRDVIEPVLENLYDYRMMTDTKDILRGDEDIRVRGVALAMQREAQRARLLEFLQLTMNPVDLQITGIEGRTKVLREVSSSLNLPEDVIPLTPNAPTGAMPGQPGAGGGPPGQVSAEPSGGGGPGAMGQGPRMNLVGPPGGATGGAMTSQVPDGAG